MTVIEPTSGSIAVAPGERFEIAVDAFAFGFDDDLQGEVGEQVGFLYDLLSGDTAASWDFGDGTKRTTPILPLTVEAIEDGENITRKREIDVSLGESHAYQNPGEYEVTVTVTDELYQRTGKASVVVRVEEETETAADDALP